MAWYDKVLPTIAAVAPTIATGLGGPLAGIAVNALFGALGVSNEKEAQEALINLNPETAAKVRAADQQFLRDMKQRDIDLEGLAVSDRASARQREITVKDKTPAVLAALLTVGFFSQLALLAFHGVPIENKEAFFILLGALGAGFTMMLQYFYGSSSSSKQKDALLADATSAAIETATISSRPLS